LTIPSFRAHHLPPYVNRCHIRRNEPNFGVWHCELAVFKVRGEHWCMKFFNFCSPMRTHSHYIREVSVLGESHRESVSVMSVPSVETTAQGLLDPLLVIFVA
jgi:hypothetical protein